MQHNTNADLLELESGGADVFDDKGSTANIIIANHVFELSLELAHGLEAAPQNICVYRREIVRVPLRKDGTAFPPLNAFPHPSPLPPRGSQRAR
jgi:hypothetical protein